VYEIAEFFAVENWRYVLGQLELSLEIGPNYVGNTGETGFLTHLKTISGRL
jgi:hypothetical protein